MGCVKFKYSFLFKVVLRVVFLSLSAGAAVWIVSVDRISLQLEKEVESKILTDRKIIEPFHELDEKLDKSFRLNSSDDNQLRVILSTDNPLFNEVRLWKRDGSFVWSSIPDSIDPERPPVEAFSGDPYRLSLENGKNRIIEYYIPSGDYLICYIYEIDSFRKKAQKLYGFLFLVFLILPAAFALLLLPLFIRNYQKKNESSRQLDLTQDVAMNLMGHMAEMRDSSNGRHLERISIYVRLLAEGLRQSDNYCNYISDKYIHDLVKAAPLHDIGKSAIPDSILLKPGKLSDEEYEKMKSHCLLGSNVLIEADKKLPFRSFLRMAAWLAAYHHEKWDGSGYPEGLEENNIPLSARIMNLADVYDALRSNRVYRKALSHEQSRNIILKGAGTQFDPEIVGAFHEQEEEFKRISIEMAD